MPRWYEHPNCLSAWLLDESSGGAQAVDAAGYKALSDTGSVGRVAGVFGNAADLDGSNYLGRDGGDVTLLSLNGVHFTVMLWVKYYALSVPKFTYPTPLAKWGLGGKQQWEISYNSGSRALEFNATEDGASGAISATFGQWQNPNTWQHLAATFDGTNVRTYLGGVLVDTVPFNGINVIGADAVDFRLSGRHAEPVGFSFKGQVDDVGVFHGEALAQADIQAIMAGGLDSSYTQEMHTLAPHVTLLDALSPEIGLGGAIHPVLGLEGALDEQVALGDVLSPSVRLADLEEELDA